MPRSNSDNQITVKFNKNKPARQSKTKRKRKAPVTRSGKSGRVISATRAARSFSELLDRVCYRGESFVIERGKHFESGRPLLLHRGQIGTVVMAYKDGAREVEFVDPDGRAFAILPLRPEQLMLLHDTPDFAAA